MKVSYNWLQKHIVEDLPAVEELKQAIIFHAFEVEDVEEINGDTVMEIKVLPDRAHDCLSHYGIARELCGLLGLTLKPYQYESLPALLLSIKVELQSDIVRRYIAIEINDVKVGPSPEWLQTALTSMGMRSINNIVDATNYVLLDRGQPVHAYDADKIDGGVVVRLAREGEQITTLSKEEKKLAESDLIIADYLGPLAIAGVKGGMSAEITNTTKNILIEVANFAPKTIRKTSRRLSLITDASKRFENELSATVAFDAASHIVSLIQELAGGAVVGVSDIYPTVSETRTLSFTLSDIARLLGSNVIESDIDLWISRYSISSTKEKDTYTITVPVERLDIVSAADIAEEIGRMKGYDNVVPAPLPFTLTSNTENEYKTISSVKYWLAQNGFREVMNYSFVKKGDVYVSYGAKDKSALRPTLSDGLKISYEKNKLNAALIGIEKVRLFEVGTVFVGETESVHVATCDNGMFEELPLKEFIEKYAIDTAPHGAISQFLKQFKQWSPYPFITRDIAIWVQDIDAQKELETIVDEFATSYCVRRPVLFDRFEKEGRTSVAYRFVFQSFEKTLMESDVEEWWKELVQKISSIKEFEIR